MQPNDGAHSCPRQDKAEKLPAVLAATLSAEAKERQRGKPEVNVSRSTERAGRGFFNDQSPGMLHNKLHKKKRERGRD